MNRKRVLGIYFILGPQKVPCGLMETCHWDKFPKSFYDKCKGAFQMSSHTDTVGHTFDYWLQAAKVVHSVRRTRTHMGASEDSMLYIASLGTYPPTRCYLLVGTYPPTRCYLHWEPTLPPAAIFTGNLPSHPLLSSLGTYPPTRCYPTLPPAAIFWVWFVGV